MNYATTAGDLLTMDQIRARFNAEWVLIEDPETTLMNEIIRGRVTWHGKDREEGWRRARASQAASLAVWYIGEPPKDMAFLL